MPSTIEWERIKIPSNGTWCWVTDGKNIWIAKRSSESAGGWSNDDTWEDFDNEIVAWIVLTEPEAIAKEPQSSDNSSPPPS